VLRSAAGRSAEGNRIRLTSMVVQSWQQPDQPLTQALHHVEFTQVSLKT
jgi:hypothetical protein